ncbi:glucose PTS transporter subunit IIA [Entomospira nematocerorum]|uniref:PTS transporter subunit EIIC n=1 Tax=Entomospira nematocerorum TaxID=2719987 RepID=A0A968GD87_9SPIO|nr:glucose PTS transporter subunit IIA [Entomospira nematocera]NIZ47318.1 PTS transporter subunit EIIC [Entomospira nematocera]WDI34140.1 glucose PTS transporter subunit IIA [Entomospira nematocera]
MKYEQFNTQLLMLLGGKKNIKSVAHCTTRLRLTLYKNKLAQTQEIEKLDGVIGVVANKIAYQIIIGTQVTDIYNEFIHLVGINNPADSDIRIKGIRGIVQSIMVVVSETMSSIVELLLAAGLIAGILTILTMSKVLDANSSTAHIFNAISSATFYFLPILVASAAAKRFGINPYIAIVLAATLLSSSINGVEGLTLFGVPLRPIVYANSFIPILLAVWFLSLVIKQLQQWLPKALHYFLLSALALSIVLPVTLLLFGPIGEWIGMGISAFLYALKESVGNWFVVMLYAAVQPFLIVFGAGNFVTPIVVHSFATQGYDPIFFAATISDFGVAGAMFGYFLRAKIQKDKQLFGTVGFSAFMGITEPAIFGVFLKYRRPFLAVMIGGGAGGLLAGLMGVKRTVYAWGLAGLPTYLDGGVHNFTWMMASVAVSFMIAGITAYGLGFPKVAVSEEEETIISTEESDGSHQILAKAAKGNIVPLSMVQDQAFSSGALGSGIGIMPIEDSCDVFSPVDGVITLVYPTKHAYGIQALNGDEILIHIGIDTVNLQGKYFESFVSAGDRVREGDRIAAYRVNKLREESIDPTIMVVITNQGEV